MIEDYKRALTLTYDEYVEQLWQKYGHATKDYFAEYMYERFKSGEIKTLNKQAGVSRTGEGLYAHHVDEDKQIMISTPKMVRTDNIPFAYQRAERLVYCNLLEHAILHALIAVEKQTNFGRMVFGIGGYVNFIRIELLDWFDDGNVPVANTPRDQWRVNCYNAIDLTPKEVVAMVAEIDNFITSNRTRAWW